VLRRGGELGWVVGCSLGGLGWGRRRRNRGGESRQSVDILAFTNGIIDRYVLSVYPSVILTVNASHQCTEIPV
jgi:hypothetical protein